MRNERIFGFRLDFSTPDPITLTFMAKKKYVLYTKQVVVQTWKYEFEAEIDLKDNTKKLEIGIEILNYIYDNGIEGHRLNDDNVQSELAGGWSISPVEEKA